jgi:hypothetical protein
MVEVESALLLSDEVSTESGSDRVNPRNVRDRQRCNPVATALGTDSIIVIESVASGFLFGAESLESNV